MSALFGTRLVLITMAALVQPTSAWAAGGKIAPENSLSNARIVLTQVQGLPQAPQLKPGNLKRGSDGRIQLNPPANAAGPKPQATGEAKSNPPIRAATAGKAPKTKRAVAGECSVPGDWTGNLIPAKRKPGRPYRLKTANTRKNVIWSSGAVTPEGAGLSFGGQSQSSDDGRPHTCILQNGVWLSIRNELRKNNPFQPFADSLAALARQQKRVAARTRYIFFQDLPLAERNRRVAADILPLQEEILDSVATLSQEIRRTAQGVDANNNRRAVKSTTLLEDLTHRQLLIADPTPRKLAQAAKARSKAEIALARAAALLDAEPPARALSPIVHDPLTGLYLMFGGDHFDYLTNDTWTFDPIQRKWTLIWPGAAPEPRASHSLKANGDGTVSLDGGYSYTSKASYLAGQYRDIGQDSWTFDLTAGRWRGAAKSFSPGTRIYRRGIFHPDYFLDGPLPDRAATKSKLTSLPANTWVPMNPPIKPSLNRDWGNAVIDLERDLMIRWSGGHSAHGGTDVPHYHLATNRWELPIPVEFPLGQLYVNTAYPQGVNFNLRPWISAHTYNSYGFSQAAKHMVFGGKSKLFHVYDPDTGDWVSRGPKPKGMDYRGSFYTLTMFPVGDQLVAWGLGLFRYLPEKQRWQRLPISRALPTPSTDRASGVYDSKRNRMLFVQTGFNRRFNGQVFALDAITFSVKKLNPKGMESAGDIPSIARSLYDPEHDLVFLGATMPPGPDGLRRTPAYDPRNNSWVTLRITGPNPSGKSGRNVSLGLVYDSNRKLYWAVNTRGQVYVLRLEPKSADVQPLR